MSHADAATKPSRSLSIRSSIVWVVLACLVATGLITLAAGPAGLAQWGRMLAHAPPPHLPRLSLFLAAKPLILVHLSCALFALGIGVVLLIGVKGTTAHRTLGYAWVACMATTAVTSLFITELRPGHWSFIHFLSGWTVIALPIGVAMARRHKVRRHARMMTSMFTGGLVLAGLFTFLPGRLMWRVFVG